MTAKTMEPSARTILPPSPERARGVSLSFAASVSSSMRPGMLFESVFPDLVEQRTRGQFEQFRGARLVAAGALEGRTDESALESGTVLLHGQLVIGQVGAVDLWHRVADVLGEIVDGDVGCFAQHHGTLDGVLELADVAGPRVLEQQSHGIRIDTTDIEAQFAIVLIDE